MNISILYENLSLNNPINNPLTSFSKDHDLYFLQHNMAVSPSYRFIDSIKNLIRRIEEKWCLFNLSSRLPPKHPLKEL